MRTSINLKAELRSETGKGAARKLRAKGRIPAILYGPKTEPLCLSVSESSLTKALATTSSGTSLYSLTIEGGDRPLTKTIMLKELQRQPVSRQVLHVDFYEVDLERTVTVEVPVRLVGKPKGVEMGGMMEQIRHDVTVTCLPTHIPEAITVDVSHLELGDALHVEDLVLEEGVTIEAETNFTIAVIVAPKAMKAGEELEEELEEEQAEATEEEGGESE